MDSLVLFLAVFFFLLAVGIPVGFSLGSTMVFLVIFKSTLPLMIVSQQMIIGADNFTLIAIPFFILAAELMGCGGIAHRLIDFVNSVVGWIRGGLGLVNVGTNMVLAGLSGSSVADAALTSSFFIPTMVKRGYGPAFSAALTAAASVMGINIPPSIPMILLGLITGQSVLSLFLGGVVPGVLIGLSLMVVTYRVARKRGYPAESRVPLREVWRRFRATLWATLYPGFRKLWRNMLI